MTVEEVKDYAEEHEVNILMLSQPDYANSIIGISSDDRVIYDYDLMIKDLMKTENLTEVDAIEFIEYNTLRALPYYENSPIILYTKGLE